MKTSVLFLLAICSTFISRAQDVAFSNVSLQNSNDREVISFTTSREINTRHYRIEASNDNVHYDVIATVRAKCNQMLPANYSYDLTPSAYIYYRVGRVEMNGQLPYSAVVKMEAPAKTNQQQEIKPVVEMGNNPTIVNK